MPMLYAAAALPAALVLSAAVVVAIGAGSPHAGPVVLKAGVDVGRARASLMMMAPVGTPADVAFSMLRDQGLSCEVSEPPLANLTWRVFLCSTPPSPSGAVLLVDVAGRHGVVADIGVEDLSCASRADATDPTPASGDCDISSQRLLAIEAQRRAAGRALLAEVLGTPGSQPRR